jgi:DNA-binding PadR family transcriptional regulator
VKLLSRAEELILLAVWKLEGEAYCIPIKEKISFITEKNWSLGSIYMPLDRLIRKGYLISHLSESTPERGGRQKRIYELTDQGKKALLYVRQVQNEMWRDLPQSLHKS